MSAKFAQDSTPLAALGGPVAKTVPVQSLRAASGARQPSRLSGAGPGLSAGPSERRSAAWISRSTSSG